MTQSEASTQQKLIIILGTTAVGKTKLSVQLAQELSKYLNGGDDQKTNNIEPRAEIISADSVQVYKGMEICSDAITAEEAQGVPHHLVGFLSPNEAYTVQDFVSNASNAIADIHHRSKIPIIAGGTLYYSESLLFKNFCSENALHANSDNKNPNTKLSKNSDAIEEKLNSIADGQLWDALHAVDAVMANFYHRNDHRRIRRSLEVFYETGQCHSTLIKQYGGKWSELRYDPLILWLDADMEVIDERINRRLTTMEDAGIFEEIEQLYEFFMREYHFDALQETETTEKDVSAPYISLAHGFGFQAFLPWLKAKYKETVTDAAQIARIRQQCLDRYGLDTRRYARKQRRWLKNRISRPALLLPIYRFDTSDKERWDEIVLQPALSIVKRFLQNDEMDASVIEQLQSVNRLGNIKDLKRSVAITDVEQWRNYHCKECDQYLHGQLEFEQHLKSKKHHKKRRNLNKQRINDFLRCENYLNHHWHAMGSF